MDRYHPNVAPDPEEWLALDDGERLLLISEYHERSGAELPNRRLHAAIHAIVENQLAEGYSPAVEALARLRRDGLGRYEAQRAIGSVLSEHTWGSVREEPPVGVSTGAYEQALRTLTAEGWREDHGKSG